MTINLGNVELIDNIHRLLIDLASTNDKNLIVILRFSIFYGLINAGFCMKTLQNLIQVSGNDDIQPIFKGFTQTLHGFSAHNDRFAFGVLHKPCKIIRKVPHQIIACTEFQAFSNGCYG